MCPWVVPIKIYPVAVIHGATTGPPLRAMEGVMTRQEHVQWCKNRALQYVDAGDLNQGYASMIYDLGKHPETKNHPAAQLGMMLLMGGKLNTKQEMRKFIEGFN